MIGFFFLQMKYFHITNSNCYTLIVNIVKIPSLSYTITIPATKFIRTETLSIT